MTKVYGKIDKNLMCLVYSFEEEDVRNALWEILSYMYSKHPEMVEL